MPENAMLGNGVIGILSESCNKWERRVPLTPSHCARLLHRGRGKTGISRIIVQPSSKRIYHDALYEDVGCEISEDLSECGLIVGVKQPKLEMILPERAYAFFSHTHKAQTENMPLLDKILAEQATLFDYELIVGNHGERVLAFGKYAGRAGMIDFLHGLGQRYLSFGYSTPFLSLGSSHMYPSLATAKAAVIQVGEEIATVGLPSGICPLVFVFTGSGNVSQGAQEIFKLLPHAFVEPSKLPELFAADQGPAPASQMSKRTFQVYGCVVTSQDMVKPQDPSKVFDKADYYSHPEQYSPIFHERIAPYASAIVNCMYWEKRFPRLLTTKQLQELKSKGCPLVGVADITCDIGGSLEFVNQTTSIDSPFFRYDPTTDSYHYEVDGDGVICSAVDILPTEFAKEASQHFGDVLSQFIGHLASWEEITTLPAYLRRACIAYRGQLTSLYEYIPRMRNSDPQDLLESLPNSHPKKKTHTRMVALSGHLFDQFLINEALDIIEAAGGSFHLVRCQVGQSTDALSYSELEVGADDCEVLDQIIDSLTSLAHKNEDHGHLKKDSNIISLHGGGTKGNGMMSEDSRRTAILILGAGRVCRPAAELLTSIRSVSSCQWLKSCMDTDFEGPNDVQVIVASLYMKDAEEVVQGIPNAIAIQLDVTDHGSLCHYVSQVDVVISLLPPSCHVSIANACIEFKRHLVTASYVSDLLSELDETAKHAGITILGEMGLDPGIDHMMAMKMIDEAHNRGGKILSFNSCCGGLPSPAAANNPLGYKFSWNPAGAIRAGRNPAIYRSNGQVIHVNGENLFDSAVRLRLPDFPAFALECLPNRNSLVYGDRYGIGEEATTVFRGTLRYEGFSEIMGTLARIGFFEDEAHPLLMNDERPTFEEFTLNILGMKSDISSCGLGEKDIAQRILVRGFCKEQETAVKTARAIIFLGLLEQKKVPSSCHAAFDVACICMEEKLAYSGTEQDMVLLHHEIEVEFPGSPSTEKHQATLLQFGQTSEGRTTTAMALTVGIPAAIGALLLLANKIKTRGVLRPMKPEVYVPEISGVPSYPLYKHLASVLYQCIADGFIQTTSLAVPPICEDSCLKLAEEKWNKLIMEEGFQIRHMLKHVSFELNVQEPYFLQLKDGLKTIEGRCAVGYYNRIRPGSSLLFNKCLILEVQDVRHYASFLEMLEGECLDKILPGVENIQEGLQIYRNFYTEEKERLNGVLAICLSRPVSQPYIALAEIISGLGYEGNQSLLGLKHTAGTIADALPPSRSALLLSFTAQHKPNVKGCNLTEGARALAKHAVRSSSIYWGTLGGSDSAKNRHAMEVIRRLIAHSCWLNLHIVPPHGAVFEIRVAEGYGARWSSDGRKFIGFLEPYMEDGHAKRWKH